jgi:hypothetical protein
MSATSETKTWITGEEYGREHRRLLDAGYRTHSPEYQALVRRVTERNDHIWKTYGIPLMDKHPGKWAAITITGDFLLATREVDVMRMAREQFGPANSCIVRLAPDQGIHRMGPRSG